MIHHRTPETPHRRLTPCDPAMASKRSHPMGIRASVEADSTSDLQESSRSSVNSMRIEIPPTIHFDDGEHPSHDNCDRENEDFDQTITISTASRMAGETVAPFLAKHIPGTYAPLGSKPADSSIQQNPNTKFCYRHRPDLKCRRTADEPKMENLQRVRASFL